MDNNNNNPPKHLENYRVPEEGHQTLQYFKNNAARDWTFDKFFDSGPYNSVLHNYKLCLSLLLDSDYLPRELKAYVGELKNKQTFEDFSKNAASSITRITNQFNANDDSKFIFYNHPVTYDKRKHKEQLQKNKEKISKKSRSYLEGRTMEDEPAKEMIKWYVDGHSVSDTLLAYREVCKEKTKSNHLSSDIDEIALNGIFYISENNKRYNIKDAIYEKMIDVLKEKFRTAIDFDLVDKFQVEKLRKIYKLSKNNAKKAKKDASDLMFDNDGYFELMCEALGNIITEHQHHITSKCLENKFTKKYVTPLFSSLMKETKHFRTFGNDEEAGGSKFRKNGQGRKSDGGYKVIYKDLEQQLLHIEIKNPNVINEDQIYHPDFVKLCNLLKDEIDLLLFKDCPLEIPVFGVLVGGHKATVYAMDLIYTHVYRLFEIGTFFIPHSLNDLGRLDGAFDIMIILNELLNKSCERCLLFLKKQSTPGTPPRRRQLHVKSFKSPQKN